MTHCKRPWCWERLRAGEEGDDRGWDGWMAWLTCGHEFEQAPGFGDEQGNLACYSPWSHEELETPEWLNWTDFPFMKWRIGCRKPMEGRRKRRKKKPEQLSVSWELTLNVYFISVFTICLSSGIRIWVKPFFKWGNQSSKRLSKLFKMLQLVLGRERIRMQVSLASKEAYWF